MAGFTIQSRDVAFDAATQSVWYDTDLAILTAALNGEGVVSGCAVTAQGSPDMTVAIAAGVVRIASGALVTVTSGNGTIGAASGSYPRIDLVSVSNAGVKTVTAGTAAASPKPPALPAGHIGLAFVLIPTSDTTIEADHITDKRCILGSNLAGQEIDYVAYSVGTVTISATTEATANTIVTGSAVTYDGSTPVWIEFWAGRCVPNGGAADFMIFWLYDGSSSIGNMGLLQTPAANSLAAPVHLRVRLTPSAASHTYSIRGSLGSTGNGFVYNDVGGAGKMYPCFIRITRA